MKIFPFIFLAGVFLLFSGEAPASDSAEGLARLAVEANPEVSMLNHEIEALSARQRAAVIWKDPVFMVEYSSMPWNEPYPGEHAMSGVQFKVQQTFPFPGKNARRQAAAAAQVDVRRLQLEELKNTLAARVKQVYWKLALARNRKAIREAHVRSVDRLFEAATARYAAGRGAQQDLMKLQVLKEKLTDDIDDFQQIDGELTAAINSVLHRDVRVGVRTEQTIPLVGDIPSFPALVERARQGRSVLAAWEKKAELHRLNAQQAAYERWPDITVWAGYRIRREAGADPGRDFVSAGLSVPIPFDYKERYNAKRAAFLADARASEEKYRLIMDEICSQMKKSLLRWHRSYDKAILYEKRLIPEARATLEAALSQWQVGKTEFSSLYQAELQVLNFDEVVVVSKAQTVLMSIEVARLAGECRVARGISAPAKHKEGL